MKQNNSLDKIFRDKLKEGKADLPADSWLQIKQKLADDNSNKKNYFKIILPSLLALFFIAGGSFYTYQLYRQNQLLKTLLKTNPSNIDSSSEDFILSQSSMSQNSNAQNYSGLLSKKYSINKNLSPKNSSKLYNPDSASIVKHPKLISKHPDNNTRNIRLQQTSLAARTSISEQEKLIPKVANNYNQQLKEQEKSNTYSKNYRDNNYSEAKTSTTIEGKENKLVQTKTGTKIDQNIDSLLSNSNFRQAKGIVSNDKAHPNNSIQPTIVASNTFENNAVKNSNHLSLDSLLVYNDSVPKKKMMEIIKPLDTVPQNTKRKKTENPKGIGIAIELMLNPEFTGRTVHFSETPLADEARAFKANDKSKFLYSGGLMVQLDVTEKFYLKTGLLYSNFGEQNKSEFLLTSADTTFEKLERISSSGVNMDSMPSFSPNLYSIANSVSKDNAFIAETWVNNENRSFQYRLNIKKSFNQINTYFDNSISYLGVPLIVGSNINFGSVKLGVFSGVVSNFLISPSKVNAFSYAQSNNNETILVNKELDLASMTFTYWGGININYSFNAHWSLNLSPSIKYFMGSIYQDKSILRQLPYAYGVSFGLVYRLRNLKW